MLDSHITQYHINVKSGDIGGYCVLPGDPGRCETIASFLDNPVKVSSNREYTIYNGTLLGETVTVCSTGIGGPSTAIAVEELALCGAHTMIRLGTSGGINLSVKAGDVVIATGAVRQDGTSREYAPIEFPAVADFDVTSALIKAAKKLGIKYKAGVVQSKDSFYGQHSPETMPTEPELKYKWEAWKRLNVLASEMEASTLFTVSALRQIKSGALFLCVWNQERASLNLDTSSDETHDVNTTVKVAIEALKILIEARNNANEE